MEKVTRAHLAGLELARHRLAPEINDERLLDELIAQASAAPVQEAVSLNAAAYRTIDEYGSCTLSIGKIHQDSRALVLADHAERLIRFGSYEIERLRAENERLREERDSFQRVGIRAMEELEAARGLLEQCALSAETLRVDSMVHAKHAGFSDELVSALRKMTGVISGHGVGSPAYPSQREALAEQGERQEASGYACAHCGEFTGKPAPYKAHVECSQCGKLTAATCAAARGFAKQYTTPQPGHDARGLVEALEHYAGCGKSGNVARVALSAHRQAQQGDSHDT